RPARDGLDQVAGASDAAVGDHVDVASTRLVEVVPAGRCDVRHGGGHRGVDAQGEPGGVGRSPAEPDEHAGSPGAHQVQGGGVRRGAADDHRDVELVDEALEVERL